MSYSSPGMSGWRTTLSGATSGSVGHIRSVSLSGIETEEVEVTTMSSSDAFREYVTGLSDPGEIQLDIVYTKTSFNTVFNALGDSANEEWTVTFPDSSTFKCSGFLKSVSIDSQMDEVIEGVAVLRLSGKPTFTASE